MAPPLIRSLQQGYSRRYQYQYSPRKLLFVIVQRFWDPGSSWCEICVICGVWCGWSAVGVVGAGCWCVVCGVVWCVVKISATVSPTQHSSTGSILKVVTTRTSWPCTVWGTSLGPLISHYCLVIFAAIQSRKSQVDCCSLSTVAAVGAATIAHSVTQ